MAASAGVIRVADIVQLRGDLPRLAAVELEQPQQIEATAVIGMQ
jgi:hypothetical protein